MIKEIFKNIVNRKEVVPCDKLRGFHGTEEALVRFQGKIDAVFGRSLRIRQVDAGSCNACEWECTALTNPVYDIQRFGVDFVASPRHADLLLISGPASRQMTHAVKKTYRAMPGPRLVVACGDCAIDGGIYKGSYAVTDGIDGIVPVDCLIAGCPPPPMQIISGLLQLMEKIRAGR